MRFNREDLLRFIGRTYNTDQMVFSIIGNISPKRFTDLCNRYFADASTHLRNFERDRTDHYQPDTKTLQFSPRALHHRQSGLQSPGREANSVIAADQHVGWAFSQLLIELGGS